MWFALVFLSPSSFNFSRVFVRFPLSSALAAGVPRRLPGRSYRASLSAVRVPDTLSSLSHSLFLDLISVLSCVLRPWAVHLTLLFFYLISCILVYHTPSPPPSLAHRQISRSPPRSRFASPARASHAFSSHCVGSCRNFRCSALSLISWDLAQRRSACNVT